MQPLREAVREIGRSVTAVASNRGLRRLQLAQAGSMIGDWAYLTAVSVWAYGVGGTSAVGIWAAVRYVLMAVSAPATSAFADRFPRRVVMVAADLARAVLVGGAGACIFLGAPAWPVFVLATLTALLGTPFRSAERALMPSLANRAEDLTAANATASTIESLSVFVGPAIGAALIGIASVQVVFVVEAATFVWSMVLVAGVPVLDQDPVSDGAGDSIEASVVEESAAEEVEGFLSDLTAGFRTVAADRRLLVVVGEVSMQTVVAGAMNVFLLVMAVEVLGTGAKGVGYLDSVCGVAAVVGGLVMLGRASSGRLGTVLAAGVVLWSLPLLLVTVWPTPAAAFLALAVLGLANPLVDVSMGTILQRITPDEVLGRVFGVLDTCTIAAMAIGALVMPALIGLLGLRGGLAVLAVVVTVAVVAGLPVLRRTDADLRPPPGLELLRSIPIFAPLGPTVLEQLARGLRRVEAAAGSVVIREGDESDRFYVIESGGVDVTVDGGLLVRQQGAGDFFGEIGLLRDVPRTATITASADTVLQALDREVFLDAVTGQNETRSLMEDIAARRLAGV